MTEDELATDLCRHLEAELLASGITVAPDDQLEALGLDMTLAGAMAELDAVSEATHAVLREAKAAGVWVFGGGLPEAAGGAVVDVDGTVHDW